jgi:pyruvate,water dikinase
MFSNPELDKKETRVFHFEDFSAKEVDSSHIGRKGMSLFELKDMDVPVPDFFVISSKAFEYTVKNALINKGEGLIKNNKNPEPEEVAKIIEKGELGETTTSQIVKAYTRMSGFSDVWVAVRSSVSFEDEKVSFSGVFDTKLNVRGVDELIKAVKHIFASVYTDQAVMYAKNAGIDLADVHMGVVVQKMVQAEVSGVAFTVDPITQDKTKMSIEAVYGLGDVIASGELTPDSYHLNKKDLSIYEKYISPQEWMRVRTFGKRGNEEKIKISNSWSHKQKLEDRHMAEVAKIALIVEEKSGKPQDIEWVLGGGKVWILQNKVEVTQRLSDPLSNASLASHDSLGDVLREVVKRRESTEDMKKSVMEDAARFIKTHAPKPKQEERVKVKEKGLEFVVSGIGASMGTAAGVVKHVPADISKFKADKGDILVFKYFSDEMEPLISQAGGVILENGGLTSDPAILARERGIPAVVGVAMATSLINEGEKVQIDGNAGSVNRINGVKELPKEAKVVIQEEKVAASVSEDTVAPPTATKVYSSEFKEGVKSGIVYLDLDQMMIGAGRHPLAYVEEKEYKTYSSELAKDIDMVADVAGSEMVVVSIGNLFGKEFEKITKGMQFEDSDKLDLRGGARLVETREFLKAGLGIVKRVRNVNRDRNVMLAIHSPMSGDVMKEIKKEVSSLSLRRSSTFKIYAIIENPSEVIVINDILDSEIDGVIFNTPTFAKQMQGVSLTAKNVKYNLDANSVLTALDSVRDAVKKRELDIVVVTENNEKLIEHCISRAVNGISVSPDDWMSAKRVVAQLEAKVVLSVG